MVSVSFSGQDPLPVNYTCALAVGDAASLQGSVFAGNVTPAVWPLGSRAECDSPATFHWLLPGSWSLSVVAEDAAGNRVRGGGSALGMHGGSATGTHGWERKIPRWVRALSCARCWVRWVAVLCESDAGEPCRVRASAAALPSHPQASPAVYSWTVAFPAGQQYARLTRWGLPGKGGRGD